MSVEHTQHQQQQKIGGGDVAELVLVECRIGTPLMQVQFCSVARIFLLGTPLSADSLTVSVHPCVQSHA